MNRIDWTKWGIRAGALALAFFLWLHAVTEHLYEKELDIRLQVEDPEPSNSQEREVIVANLSPNHVRVAVVGRGKDLLQLESSSFFMRLTPEGRPGSVRIYRLTPTLVENRTSDVELEVEEVIEPKEIEIALDWRAEREVAVNPRIELEIAERYVQVGKISIDPPVVRVSGPRGQIGQVHSVSTDSLVLKGVQEDVQYELALLSPPNMRCELNPTHVRVEADVQILAQDELDQVPVEVRYSAGRRVEVAPSRVRVKVKGGYETIAYLDPEKDLELFVDYRDLIDESLPVLYEKKDLFEIVEIDPPRVGVIQR